MHAYLIKTKLKILFLYVIAYAMLWLGYAVFIVPVFGYMGFEWAPNRVKLAESLLVVVFFALSLPSRIKRPSDFFIHVHYLMPVVPMLFYIVHQIFQGYICTLSFWLSLLYAMPAN